MPLAYITPLNFLKPALLISAMLASAATPLAAEKVRPAGVYVPGEILLAGPAVVERGSDAAFYLWSEEAEEPYYFSERGTSGDGKSTLIWKVEGPEGEVVRQGKSAVVSQKWQKLATESARWRSGRHRIVATLIFSGTEFSRVIRDVTVVERDALAAEAAGVTGKGESVRQVTLPGEGRVVLYATFQVPTPELRVSQGEEMVGLIKTFDDERFSEKELFLGYLDAGREPAIVEAVDGRKVGARAFRIVRLEGVVREQSGSHEEQQQRMRLVVNNDGVSEGFFDPAWNVDRLPEQVYRYRASDVSQLDWAALVSGVVSFRSRFADFYGEGFEGKWPNARENKAMMRAFTELEQRDAKLYPWLVALGKEIGVSVWGSLRMNAYYGTHPFGVVMNGRLWREHPEMRIKGSKGERVHFGDNMSFAYDEVQQQRIGVLTELAEAGCDGVNLDFCRYPGVLGYDGPLLEQFRKKHGRDGRTVALDDPRWRAIRQGVMNGFMRAVRTAMNEAGEKRGQPVKVSVRFPANRYDTFGFDPQTWIREGWVDIVIPAFPGRDRWFDVKPWDEMRKDAEVELLVGIEHTLHKVSQNELTDDEKEEGIKPGYQFTLKREDYLRRAAEVYENGGDGLYVFNAWAQVDMLKGVADREYVATWRRYQDAMNLGSLIDPTFLSKAKR